MKFAITGMGRSGTTYVSRYLNSVGISNLHETNMSWPFASPTSIPDIERNPACVSGFQGVVGWQWEFRAQTLMESIRYQFFLTRHPLKAIPSATTHNDAVLSFLEQNLGLDRQEPIFGIDDGVVRLRRCASIWCKFVERNEAANRVHLSVEDFNPGGRSLRKFLSSADFSIEIEKCLISVPVSVNSRKHLYDEALSSPRVMRRMLGHDLWSELVCLASKRGYSLE